MTARPPSSTIHRMLLARPLRLARLLAVLLALVANLIAAGVPVLHALAHEVAEEHHPSSDLPAVPQVDHGHDKLHADALHEERVLNKRQAIDPAFLSPAEAEEPASFISPERITHRPALRLASRAPPSTDLARAPPLA